MEAVAERRVAGALRREELQRDRTPEAELDGAVDDAHAAAAGDPFDAAAGELIACRELNHPTDCDAALPRGYAQAMDLGNPISYLVLADGTPVLASDGQEVGRVEHVLADPDADLFDGVIVDMRAGPGGHRFVDADQVDAIHEHGVVLALDAEAAARLPEPAENPATLSADPDDTVPDTLSDKLRRAWDYLSGRY